MKTESGVKHSALSQPGQKPQNALKRLALTLGIFGGAISLLFAQGRIFNGRGAPYDPKTPPGIPLPQAYSLAIARVGPATNRFYCVSASCLEKTLPSYAGWVFLFANTNGDRARVEVYFGDKGAYVPDARSEELLK